MSTNHRLVNSEGCGCTRRRVLCLSLSRCNRRPLSLQQFRQHVVRSGQHLSAAVSGLHFLRSVVPSGQHLTAAGGPVASAVAFATRIARLALSRSLRTLNRYSLRSGVSGARLSLSRSRLRRRRSAWAGSTSSSLKHVHCAVCRVCIIVCTCTIVHPQCS